MGRKPCCKNKFGMMKKGSWTIEEDRKLTGIFLKYGQCRWSDVPKLAGLWRCPKSCRLRWINYLRPDVKRGPLSESEERVVISLHSKLGNKWSQIASHLPGRTDNEIKNIWNTTLRKKLIRKEIDYQAQKSFSISFCSSDKKKDEFADHQSEGNSQSWVTSSVHTNSSRSSSGGDSGLSHEFQMEFPGLDFDDHRVVNHVLPTSKRSDDDQEILKSSPNQSNSSEYDKVDRNSPESSQYLSNVDIDWDSFIDELDQLIPEFSLI